MDSDTTVQWLRDRELIREVPQRYAFGVDRRDFAIVRACFTDDCYVSGSRNAAPIEEYLATLEPGVRHYPSTLHFMGNQYVDVEPGADTGHVETYAVAYHMPDDGNDLVMGVRYCDDVRRVGDGWLICARTAVPQWVRGDFPDVGG